VTGFRILHEVDHSVIVRLDGVELAEYVYAPDTAPRESPKPYLHPLRTRGGHLVSLFRPHDHVWHKGIAWSLPHVGAENFWGGPTFTADRSYVQLENNGRAEHAELLELRADAGSAVIAHRLDWITQAGARIIDETRRLTASLGDPAAGTPAWVLTFESRMRNVGQEDLWIGSPTTKGRENAGYGGLFWRGPRSFTNGRLRTADGDGGDELRGTRHAWMGFTGAHDGVDEASTIVMVDDPGNIHHPPQWFARSEEFACLCPAPFFSEEVLLARGEELIFRYAVVIADGAAPGAEVRALAETGSEALAGARV
jgi:hypothetical protein